MAWGCEPETAQSEFLLSKKLYERNTGRNQGKRDVIAYHICMSFKPGEVTAAHALMLGKDLAFRWTKGKHQFIVAAHTNTNNPHCHIIYNSTNIDCNGKYQDFKRSAIALRRLSDQICLEHGLSIIEKPGLSKGYNRAEYIGENKLPTVRDNLRDLIDNTIQIGMFRSQFIEAMQKSGCEVKQGKHLSFKLPDSKKFIRLNSLGEDYSESAIMERLSGRRIFIPKQKPTPIKNENSPNLLIDIQEKMAQGKGAGYEHWANTYNLKESAKTLIFLEENKALCYDDLIEKEQAAAKRFREMTNRIKEIEPRLKEITELQKQIGTYRKTREVYKQYITLSGKKQERFYNEHYSEIALHKAAKKHFDSLGYSPQNKLPKIDELKQEYAVLLAEKNKLYSEYKQAKRDMTDWHKAKYNADRIFGRDEKCVPKKSHYRDER